MKKMALRLGLCVPLSFSFALIMSACTPQENLGTGSTAAQAQVPNENTTTLDIVFLPDELSDIAAWQNVEQHLANVAPYITSEERPLNIVNEIIVTPTKQAFNEAMTLSPRSLRLRCQQLTREWIQANVNCLDVRIAAYAVAALDDYEQDLTRDIMAQELMMKHHLGNGLRRILGQPTEFAPNAKRDLVVRLAVW